ncbi:MAG: NusG domain II-containing protein [Nitrospinota bacterium]
MFTKGDKFLIALFLLLNLISIPLIVSFHTKGETLLIEIDNKELYRIPLSIERVIHVKGSLGITEIKIRDGRARITRSPCRNKICVRMGWISYRNGISVCVPNRVVARIQGDNRSGYDAIVR